MYLTQIMDLSPGDEILLDGELVVLRWVDEYGDTEMVLTDTSGKCTILSNDNWFEVQ